MKRFLALLGLVLTFTIVTQTASAQDKYTYRSGNFAVRVTTNPSGTEAKQIEYTNAGKWYNCTIMDRVPDDSGINYVVDDGTGVYFSVYYEPNVDKLVVTNLNTEQMMVLDRSQH